MKLKKNEKPKPRMLGMISRGKKCSNVYCTTPQQRLNSDFRWKRFRWSFTVLFTDSINMSTTTTSLHSVLRLASLQYSASLTVVSLNNNQIVSSS